jgi:L-lactate dehydrogenase
VPQIVAVAPDAVLTVVTDPPDPRADLTRQMAKHDRVLSTGTLATVVGEHGTSEVPLWSSASVGGANITIIEGTGASQYGIGVVSAVLVEAVSSWLPAGPNRVSDRGPGVAGRGVPRRLGEP